MAMENPQSESSRQCRVDEHRKRASKAAYEFAILLENDADPQSLRKARNRLAQAWDRLTLEWKVPDPIKCWCGEYHWAAAHSIDQNVSRE